MAHPCSGCTTAAAFKAKQTQLQTLLLNLLGPMEHKHLPHQVKHLIRILSCTTADVMAFQQHMLAHGTAPVHVTTHMQHALPQPHVPAGVLVVLVMAWCLGGHHLASRYLHQSSSSNTQQQQQQHHPAPA
jgi:hypothetical protein